MKASRSARYLSVFFLNAGILSACSAHGADEKTSAIDSHLVVESAACKVEYDIPSAWDTGFTGNVIVTNKGSAINSWKLEWDFSGSQSVSSAWNAS
ncbi:MAG TPA: cellulose binding domain-containing protein, partial [Polyangiaceae bacterium]|nr:cellulose binding domain-containing protein [Polyangiaceae bacterium]